jgi:hypothetical protein
VSVSFAEGDEEGKLTSEVVRALFASKLVDIRSVGGDYQLKLSILNNGAEKIGFRVDTQKVDGKIKRNLLACEGRKSVTVQATLFSGEKSVYGPFQITSDADYDYVDGDSIQDLTFVSPSGQTLTVLPFSLGQLESTESAQEASLTPLYRNLAQKIVDAISSQW